MQFVRNRAQTFHFRKHHLSFRAKRNKTVEGRAANAKEIMGRKIVRAEVVISQEKKKQTFTVQNPLSLGHKLYLRNTR